MFIGVKMLAGFVGVHFSVESTLIFVVAVLLCSVAMSHVKQRKKKSVEASSSVL